MSDFKKMVNETMKTGVVPVAEVSPPGFKGTVKAMKQHSEIDNPWRLAWYMKNKGYKSHKKASGSPKNENASMGGMSAGSIASTAAPMEDYGSDEAHPEGSRVKVAINSGLNSDKTGVIVGQRYVKTDGRGTPTNIPGAYKPVDWNVESAVMLDNGQLITMFNDRLIPESIRIFSYEKGKGTVLEVADTGVLVDWDNKLERVLGPERISLKAAKYLELIKETNPVIEAGEYSDDPEDVEVDSDKKKKRKSKNKNNDKIDEGVIGIAAISGTFRGSRIMDEYYRNLDFDLDSVTLNDLLENDEDYEQEEEASSDESSEPEEFNRGEESEAEAEKTPDGSDYVNVPSPSDTILTNQSKQARPKPKPLSTWDEEPGDGDSPDGDSKDMAPVDAPDPLNWKELETDRHNTRDVGDDGEDTKAVDKTNYADDGDSEPVSDNDTSDASDDDSSDKSGSTDSSDDEEKKMANENFNLSYEDLDEELGLIMTGKSGAQNLFEGETGTGVSGYGEDGGDEMGYNDGEVNEHDMGGGEIAFTRELLDKLLASVAEQSPTDKLDYICQGLESAQQDKGDMALDVGDMDMIMGKIKDAASGGDMGGDDMGGDDMGGDMGGDDYDNEPDVQPEGGEYDDTEMEYDENRAGGDARGRSQGNRNPDGEGARDDAYGQKASDYSGSAERHEGHGDYYDDDDYSEEDRAEGDGKRAGPEGGREHEGKKMFMDHLGMQEDKGSGTPISSHTTKGSGPGGGSTKDLSAPKEKKAGTPVGTGGNSGPGGGSGDQFGQKPSDDGGSNLLPAYDDGNQLGVPGQPIKSADAKLNPQNKKALASEGMKRRRARARKRLDEHLLLGISAIPGTIRNVNADEHYLSEDDPDYDIKLMRKRAGIDKWWKV